MGVENDARAPAGRCKKIEPRLGDGMATARESKPLQRTLEKLAYGGFVVGRRGDVDELAGQRDGIDHRARDSIYNAGVDVVIAGLGLIGGSLGKALRGRGWRVSFVDPHVTLAAAEAAGAADEKRDRLEGDLIVLATPSDVTLNLLGELRGTNGIVTSVSGVMTPLREAATDINFVAGHPFAGSELRGLEAANASLFESRPWFVDRHLDDTMTLIAAAGAEPVVVDAAEHDRIMALTSHLPQVVATALASLLDGVDSRFIGTGAKSMLRLAGSSYGVWEPILDQNNENISAAAEQLWNTMRTISAEDFERAHRLYGREIK